MQNAKKIAALLRKIEALAEGAIHSGKQTTKDDLLAEVAAIAAEAQELTLFATQKPKTA